MNRNPASSTNGGVRPEAVRFIQGASSQMRGTSCVKARSTDFRGRATPTWSSGSDLPNNSFHHDLAAPNMMNRIGLGT